MNKRIISIVPTIVIPIVLLAITSIVFAQLIHGNHAFAVTSDKDGGLSNTTTTSKLSEQQQLKNSSILNLTNQNTPVVIPLLKGLYDGKDVFYISTEVSDKAMKEVLGNFSGSPVNLSPNLSKSLVVGQLWVFKNGVKGAGPLGFQANVFDSIPGDTSYTPLWKVNMVEWNKDSIAKATVLGSDDDVSDAASKNLIKITPTNVVVNCPIVMWSGNKDNTIPPGHI